MGIETGTFIGVRGLKLFYRHWSSEIPGSPKAALVLVHGAAEHSGRYEHVGTRFAALGYDTWAFDLPGLGRSEGTSGHIDDFADYLEDLRILAGRIRSAVPGVKVILTGHSMGGLIVLAYAERHPATIDGVIISAPLLGLTMRVPPVKAAMARLLSGILPRLSQENELVPSALSRNPEVGRRYMADPLLRPKVTLRFYTELVRTMEETRAGAPGLKDLPVLILQGGADRIVDAAKTRVFYEQMGETDKEYQEFEGFYHEIFNEDEREQVFKVMDGWLAKRTR